LDDTVDHRVPPEFRQGFLERNPVNRALIEAAQHTLKRTLTSTISR
jgi:hypothetical protein